jgi:cytochrome c
LIAIASDWSVTMRDVRRSALFAAIFAIAIGVARPVHAQDAAHGASVFKVCAACHANDNTNRTGPGLKGILGRTAGTVLGFRYSRAMKQSGIVWDEKSLDAYLTAPQKAVPGNIMPFSGLKDARDRADLIAYLATLK